nr:ParA [Serratia grimesii]
MDLKSTLDRCIERGQFMTQEIAKAQFGNDSPEARAITRRWRITEASDLVGVTAQTIRNYEESGKLPSPETAMIGRVEQRTGYSIQQINAMRDVFGTRPTRPAGQDPVVLAVAAHKGGLIKHPHRYILLNGWHYRGYVSY